MEFELKEEWRMLKDLVARFVREELVPLEPALLQREAEGGSIGLSEEEGARIDRRSRELGLWGLDAPQEIGGSDLPMAAMVGVNEEMGHSIVPYYLPPDTPNLRLLMLTATPEQKKRYLEPYVRGETKSAIVISEPGAGGDPSGLSTRAVRDGDHWVINGRKIWISNLERADFGIVMARTSGSPGSRGGISAFIVDKGTPGFIPARKIPMIGGSATWEVLFDDCRIPAGQLLGTLDQGFEPMQARLGARRVQMAAWAIGKAQRALDMLCTYAPQRKTFGLPLSERQAIQWWIADAATRIHATRLMTYECAWRIDRGLDVRTQTSMVKAYATEMAWEVVDRAMQTFGAMGMTKELPLQQMANAVRLMRIYEGPTEVHRMVVARNTLARFR
ncbi:acyl-CoA dehydrogenase family protein [Pseudorhodoferax sp. Leaf274]|uniref:acyl-CoA dehydrogenase family protein n=1 Tax=Pseudorhodoferax sp. Leaf274 TaxID=1736318 RepID=UPI0007037C18|nr:acyl-CoA dehydrogenase [Pseudorhodoferax sp. Leaf274]KQP37504.1 acyl-CoA dehydrogenase [Pseudorhodoferax sp. Leaf274]